MDADGTCDRRGLYRSTGTRTACAAPPAAYHGARRTWQTALHLPRRRFAIVGPRRRDAIHPFFNAQFGVVQLMLNALCPLIGEGVRESEKERVAKMLGWLNR